MNLRFLAVFKPSLRSKKSLRKDNREEKQKDKPRKPEDIVDLWYGKMPHGKHRWRKQSAPHDVCSSSQRLADERLGPSADDTSMWILESAPPKEPMILPELDFDSVHRISLERGRSTRRSKRSVSLGRSVSDAPHGPSSGNSIESLQRTLGSTFGMDSSTSSSFPGTVRSRSTQQLSSRWHDAPARYSCRVVHPCSPPDGVLYQNLPFFELRLNDFFEVLKEACHPSLYADLPLYVDDGEDCLLLVRDTAGDVGWALASFLVPLD